jgi:glycosyltransferase involved in cell wall biosynthesis
MNFLFWNDTLEVGGGETWALRTALHLRKRGHAVSFACPSGSWTEAQALQHGVPYFDYFFDPAFCAHFLWQAEAFLRKHAVDAVLCTVMGNRTEAALLAGLIRKVGRGAALLRVGAAPWAGLSTAHLGYGMEDVVRGTLVNSSFLKRQILSRFPELPPERVEVLHNGVDTDALDPARCGRRGEVRRELGVSEETALVTAVGRLTAVKNYPLLLRSFARALRSFPEAALAVAGEGEELESLKALSGELGIADRVRFTGFRKEVSELLHASDLFAHASLMEGLPNAILEAMAMGRAVVATEVGGVPELVAHGETGLLTPSGDEEALAGALLRLLNAPETRGRMGDAGRLRVRQRFDQDAQALRLETYLESLGGWRAEMTRPRFPLPSGAGVPPQPPEMFFPRRCHRRYPSRSPLRNERKTLKMASG